MDKGLCAQPDFSALSTALRRSHPHVPTALAGVRPSGWHLLFSASQHPRALLTPGVKASDKKSQKQAHSPLSGLRFKRTVFNAHIKPGWVWVFKPRFTDEAQKGAVNGPKSLMWSVSKPDAKPDSQTPSTGYPPCTLPLRGLDRLVLGLLASFPCAQAGTELFAPLLPTHYPLTDAACISSEPHRASARWCVLPLLCRWGSRALDLPWVSRGLEQKGGLGHTWGRGWDGQCETPCTDGHWPVCRSRTLLPTTYSSQPGS